VVIGAEFVFRKRYVEPVREATPLILEIQQYLELDSVIGFRWKPNIDASEGIVFEDGDAVAYPLSTDHLGFINSPQAKADIEAGKRPNIIGVGDSFLEHGAHVLTEYFAEHDLVYRNMAMHRTSPPQFTDVVEAHALPLKPNLIVYSIYENDFQEVADYMNWEDSGLDWFTFHSGTWCGPPLAASATERRADAWVPGYRSVYQIVESRIPWHDFRDGQNLGVLPRMNVDMIRAYDIADELGVRLVVLLIPSRESVLESPSNEAQRYDVMATPYEGLEFVDLRTVYGEHPDPASLYYENNGHWNEVGIKIAADEILRVYNERYE